jgi:polyisoprenoid-binding protein YceI
MVRGVFFFLVMVLAASAAAQTGTWNIYPNHSSAQFSVRNLGVSNVRGAFTKVNGSGT